MNTVTKRELKKLFWDYTDLVRLPELCAMMGGIGDSTARKLLREGHIRSIMVRSTYYIPKTCIIDYLLSSHYKRYKLKLKHVIPKGSKGASKLNAKLPQKNRSTRTDGIRSLRRSARNGRFLKRTPSIMRFGTSRK